MEAGHSSKLLAPRYGATLHPILDDSNLLYSYILFFLLSEPKTSPSALIFNVGRVLIALYYELFFTHCCNSAVYTKANIHLCYVYEFIFLM